MPIYEYECENCGTRFERFQSMQDEPVRQCPECSGAVHKVFHPAGIIFKGSGWYITDSRKASSGAVMGETKTDGKSSDSHKAEDSHKPAEGTKKTESKPATEEKKADTKSDTATSSAK